MKRFILVILVMMSFLSFSLNVNAEIIRDVPIFAVTPSALIDKCISGQKNYTFYNLIESNGNVFGKVGKVPHECSFSITTSNKETPYAMTIKITPQKNDTTSLDTMYGTIFVFLWAISLTSSESEQLINQSFFLKNTNETVGTLWCKNRRIVLEIALQPSSSCTIYAIDKKFMH